MRPSFVGVVLDLFSQVSLLDKALGEIVHWRAFLRAVFLASVAFLLFMPSSSSWAVVPTLVKVTPETIVAGSQSVSLAIQGTGLIAGTVAMWGATALTTTVLGDTSVVASLPDASVASVGVGIVTLENGQGTSNGIGVLVVDSLSKQLEPVLYVAAGLLGALAFILGMGQRW